MLNTLTASTIDHADTQAAPRAWEETVTLPTYRHGEPLPHPMFLDKRIYQGSSGKVYPFPVIDKVGLEKINQPYRAVFLENRWLKIMLLPELGGRVHMAYDKQHDYHFVYFNQVVKPALVGLAGPWISGGIEFNWPQHHRPSTFAPVGCHVEHDPDTGVAACVMAETDRMHGTRSVARFSLAPDHAALRIDVTLSNPTDQPQTFLWWANPAVVANEDYQSIFPPDVHAVMDHGKRDVSEFPVARGEYYKVDYSQGPEPKDDRGRGGTDISRYKNIPVPTSFMAYHSDFDFMGGYDHGKQMGLLHVADHHRVPGKKQWTWGNGDFGTAWDRELTDEDGPYVELMIGAYTDNQPDFSWLEPGEEKRFTQHFMPYRGVGQVKNATTDVHIGLEPAGDGKARVAVGVTRDLGPLTTTLTDTRTGDTLWTGSLTGTPGQTLIETIDAAADPADLRLAVANAQGEMLVSYQPETWDKLPVPDPAQAVVAPADVETVEQCFLAGQHLEQYRHGSREPSHWYREGLRRDPGDTRCNNALGLLLMRRGAFDEAEPLFRAAIRRQLERNPNPSDGEPYYNLGQCLFLMGRHREASDALQKAAWNAGFQGRGYAAAARAEARMGNLARAIELVHESLLVEPRNALARDLRLALGVAGGEADTLRAAAQRVLEGDPLHALALFVLHRLGDDDATARLKAALAGDASRVLGLAQHPHQIGQPALTLDALSLDPVAQTDPQLLYLAAVAHAAAGDTSASRAALRAAAAADPGGCFPSRVELIAVLESAMRFADDAGMVDGHAPYLLANLLYDKKQDDRAIALWEQAVEQKHGQPLAWRNLGLAYYNRRQDPERALAALRTAFELDPADARLLYELDQLRKEVGHDPAERLAAIEAHPALIEDRDDLYTERVRLLNTLGRPAEALALIEARTFHPWEGGEGRVPNEYRVALLQLAAERLADGDAEAALAHLDRALTYPHHLGEGKLVGQTDNDLHLWRARCLTALGRDAEAAAALEAATAGELGVGEAKYYNDQPPEMTFWAGLACRALGRSERADALFRQMAEHAAAHADDEPEIDYFAVSLPNFLVFEQDLAAANRRHCLLLTALSQLGTDDTAAGHATLDRVLAERPDEQLAVVLKRLTAESLVRGASSATG